MDDKPESDKDRRSIDIDPAVANLIDQGKQRQEERSLSPDERKKRAREREKLKRRNRKMLDLPEEITDRLEQLAQEIGCPESQIAAFLLAEGLRKLEDGDVDFDAHLRASRSPRYRFNLVHPDFDEEA